MELIELYESMIKSIIKKYLSYANKVGLDYDDLYQEASIAVLRSQKTYKDNKDMKLETWIYNNVEWHLQRVLKKNSKYKDVISINSEITSTEGDTVTLLDLIADDNDYFKRVEDAIMVQTYKEEAKRVLPKNKYDICALRWFHNYSYEAIEKVLGCKSISNTLMQSRIELIKKSKLFRSEYNKFHNINDYSEVSRLVF